MVTVENVVGQLWWVLYEDQQRLRFCVTTLVQTVSGRIVEPTKPMRFYTSKEAIAALERHGVMLHVTLCASPLLQVWGAAPKRRSEPLESDEPTTEEDQHVRADE